MSITNIFLYFVLDLPLFLFFFTTAYAAEIEWQFPIQPPIGNHKDCSAYYECVNGVPILEHCPPGLHWSESEKLCTYPELANCTSGPAEVQLDFKDKVEMKCPWPEPEDPVYFPHPTNCSLYYECSNGVPILEKCPPGLHWSPSQDICTFPQDAHCTSETTTPPNWTKMEEFFDEI